MNNNVMQVSQTPYQTASAYVLSKDLRQFLTEWYEWATTEPVEDKFPMVREAGLCSALWKWCGKNNMGNQTYRVLDREMKLLFVKDGLDITYPFGESSFNWCMYAKSQHQDPARLAWVRAALELPTKEEY